MVTKHKAHLLKMYKLGTYGKLTKRASIISETAKKNCTGIYLSHLKNNTSIAFNKSVTGDFIKYKHANISQAKHITKASMHELQFLVFSHDS